MDFSTIITDSKDIWLNLSLEEYLAEQIAQSPLLFLWLNRASVVVGRNQVPWLECDVDALSSHHTVLARRMSGGGTVYHDEGNVNYTFIVKASEYDRQRCFDVVLNMLADLNLDAVRTARNDIVIDDWKISGSAFRITKNYVIHHGTLLVDADLKRMSAVLSVQEARYQSAHTRGIRSTRSPVINLNSLNANIDVPRIIDAFIAQSKSGAVEKIEADQLPAMERVAERASEISSWQWCYGRSPEFTVTLPLSLADNRQEDVQIKIDGGIIAAVDCGHEKGLAIEPLIGERYHFSTLMRQLVND